MWIFYVYVGIVSFFAGVATVGFVIKCCGSTLCRPYFVRVTPN